METNTRFPFLGNNLSQTNAQGALRKTWDFFPKSYRVDCTASSWNRQCKMTLFCIFLL